jgi:phage shock protein E
VGCHRGSQSDAAQEEEETGQPSAVAAPDEGKTGPPSTAAVAWSKIDAGAILIDVRTGVEFDAGHLDGAINIPFDTIAAGITAAASDTDAEIVLYCRTGRRSALAAESLPPLGYRNIFNAGGYEDLMRARQ